MQEQLSRIEQVQSLSSLAQGVVEEEPAAQWP
jgi:hypothetical protein